MVVFKQALRLTFLSSHEIQVKGTEKGGSIPCFVRLVGRVTPCAPFARKHPRTGAHGVTRPTLGPIPMTRIGGMAEDSVDRFWLCWHCGPMKQSGIKPSIY